MDLVLIENILNQNQDLLEQIGHQSKLLEQKINHMLTIVSGLHQSKDKRNSIFSQLKEMIEKEIQPQLKTLSEIVPYNEYFKYNDQWNRSLQNLCFICALIEFFESQQLITIDKISQQLKLPVNENGKFHIPIEDILHGLITMIQELSRLSMTSIIYSDFELPVKISKFVQQVFSGFQLLNMKNDLLRKRFDGIKYELKKIEEVVFQLKLRKLID